MITYHFDEPKDRCVVLGGVERVKVLMEDFEQKISHVGMSEDDYEYDFKRSATGILTICFKTKESLTLAQLVLK